MDCLVTRSRKPWYSIVDFEGRVPPTFLFLVAFLISQALLSRSSWRTGFIPLLGNPSRPPDEMGQSLACIATILFPRAKAVRSDDEHTFFVHSFSRDLHQSVFDLLRKGGRPANIESQLDTGGSLIDMLTSRARRLDVALVDILFVKKDGLCYTHKNPGYLFLFDGSDAMKTPYRRSPKSFPKTVQS